MNMDHVQELDGQYFWGCDWLKNLWLDILFVSGFNENLTKTENKNIISDISFFFLALKIFVQSCSRLIIKRNAFGMPVLVHITVLLSIKGQKSVDYLLLNFEHLLLFYDHIFFFLLCCGPYEHNFSKFFWPIIVNFISLYVDISIWIWVSAIFYSHSCLM